MLSLWWGNQWAAGDKEFLENLRVYCEQSGKDDLANKLQEIEESPITEMQAELPSVVEISKQKDGKQIDHYIIYDDETVLDTKTGLMWMRCALGQAWDGETCIGSPSGMNWDTAWKQSEYDFAGHQDWRLPTIDELRTLVDTRYLASTFNRSVFINCPSDKFWSSSLLTGWRECPNWESWHDYLLNGIKCAWVIDFYKGGIEYSSCSDNIHYVRLVRGSLLLTFSKPISFNQGY